MDISLSTISSCFLLFSEVRTYNYYRPFADIFRILETLKAGGGTWGRGGPVQFRDIPREPCSTRSMPGLSTLIFPPMWRLASGSPLSGRNFPQKLTFCWFYDHFTDGVFRGYSATEHSSSS